MDVQAPGCMQHLLHQHNYHQCLDNLYSLVVCDHIVLVYFHPELHIGSSVKARHSSALDVPGHNCGQQGLAGHPVS